jgi:hypothetical protein
VQSISVGLGVAQVSPDWHNDARAQSQVSVPLPHDAGDGTHE